MHVPTHIMSGWCLGNLVRLTPRERLFCMVAATAADLDGLSILFGQEAYWDYHHVVCHNLFFAVALSTVLAAFSAQRLKAFAVFLAAAHLHLVLDYFGSGPGWPIHYGWPVFHWVWKNPVAWEFNSWQNRLAALVFLVWVLLIAVFCGRTPVELITPDLDRRFVVRLRTMFGMRNRSATSPESSRQIP
jgi:inner membrane protein